MRNSVEALDDAVKILILFLLSAFCNELLEVLMSRMEEDLMSRKGHPADRIIDLEFHRAELLARMRDFVWAVRRLDRITGLLRLPSSNSNLFKR